MAVQPPPKLKDGGAGTGRDINQQQEAHSLLSGHPADENTCQFTNIPYVAGNDQSTLFQALMPLAAPPQTTL